jgi:hypothetical protein
VGRVGGAAQVARVAVREPHHDDEEDERHVHARQHQVHHRALLRAAPAHEKGGIRIVVSIQQQLFVEFSILIRMKMLRGKKTCFALPQKIFLKKTLDHGRKDDGPDSFLSDDRIY